MAVPATFMKISPGGHVDTSLIIATDFRFVDVVKLLLGYGANANTRSGRHGDTLLLISAPFPCAVEAVGLLLNYGADVQARNNTGDNLLLLASSTGQSEVVVVPMPQDNHGQNRKYHLNNNPVI